MECNSTLAANLKLLSLEKTGKMQLKIYSHLSPIFNAEKKHLNRIDLWRS